MVRSALVYVPLRCFAGVESCKTVKAPGSRSDTILMMCFQFHLSMSMNITCSLTCPRSMLYVFLAKAHSTDTLRVLTGHPCLPGVISHACRDTNQACVHIPCRLKEFENSFLYLGQQTCAADGMCQVASPSSAPVTPPLWRAAQVALS